MRSDLFDFLQLNFITVARLSSINAVLILQKIYKEVITIEFRELTKDDKKIFDKYLGLIYHDNSAFNFTNFFMWRKYYNLRWAIVGDALIVKYGDNFLQPFCADENVEDAIKFIVNEYKKNPASEFIFINAEKNFVEQLEKIDRLSFEFLPLPNRFDYVYSTQDLINLSGRKYHRAKNLINAFRNLYPSAQYVSNFNDEIKNLCVERLNIWYTEHDLTEYPALPFERAAILEVLDDFNLFELKFGAIIIAEKVMAFTFGEKLNEDTAVIHIEKANFDIKGAYAFINQQFVAQEWKNLPFINREEDLGIEGIKAAKEAYRPVKMIEKFNVILR